MEKAKREKRVRARMKWVRENRERYNAYCRAWYAKNRKRRREYLRAKWASLPTEKKKAQYARQASSNASLRAEMLAAYGGRCACCGESESRFLTLEHIYHDGAAHRRRKSQPQILKELKGLGWPKDRYTILCMNCNWAERQGEPCPHKLKTKFIVVG